MSDSERPVLTLKVNLFHDVRHDDRNVSDVKERLLAYLNHPDAIAEGVRIETLDGMKAVGADCEVSLRARISVGHKASAVFLELAPHRFSEDSLDSIARNVARGLDSHHYADDVRVDDWLLEATKPGKRV